MIRYCTIWQLTRLSTILSMILLTAFPARADDIEELKKQIEILAKKIELLEKQQNEETETAAETAIQGTGNTVTSGDVPGSFKLPGTDTSVRIQGYINADFIYDIGNRPTSRGGDIASTHTAILEGTPEYNNRGDARLGARNSRFSIATFTPTDLGRLRTVIEADFNGPPNEKASRATTGRTAFGLRHAYGELGNFLTGHYWSNFSDNSTFPKKVDGTGPAGRNFMRQGQIRYTHNFGKGARFAIALENPKGDFNGANDTTLDDSMPDLTFHYRKEMDRWHLQVAGVLRRYGNNIDHISGATSDDVTGWGLNHSGSFLLPDSEDRISWYLVLGNGLGRYIEGGVNQGATVGPDGKLDAQFAYGGFVTYRHWWTRTLQSNIDFGMAIYDLNLEEVATANEKLFSSHLNLIWTPNQKMEFGMEYVWGHRKVHDGRTGDIDRIQFNSIYYF